MSAQEPRWLKLTDVKVMQEDQLRLFGGMAGIRDVNALESALDRPKNLFRYEQADLASLAACYAHGIVKNHPFLDGNKRTALITTDVFLKKNGLRLTLSEPQAVEAFCDLATSRISQQEFASIIRQHSRVIEQTQTIEPTAEISRTRTQQRERGREM